MFLVSAAEDTANTIGKLVGSEQSLGLGNLAFAMDPLGLDRVQPRALLGRRHATMRTPASLPLVLTSRLWAAIQLRTSLLLCQEAFSQIKSSAASLPAAASLSVQ